MKRLLVIGLWLAAMSANGDVLSNLLARWAYTNAADIGEDSLGAYDLTATNAANLPTYSAENGAVFDGANDYLRGTGPLLSNVNAFTVCTWFHSLSNAAALRIYTWQNADASRVTLYNDTVNLTHYIRNTATAAYKTVVGCITTGRWYHAALTFDNAANAQKLYLDGIEVFTYDPPAANTPADQSQVVVGAFRDGANTIQGFNGYIDETRVYSVALGSGEVVEVHAASRNPSAPTATPRSYGPAAQMLIQHRRSQ